METAKVGASALQESQSTRSANVIVQNRPQTTTAGYGQGGARKGPNTRPNSACWRCGKINHSPDNCFYKRQRCRACGKYGHIARKCQKQQQGTHAVQQKEESVERLQKLLRSTYVDDIISGGHTEDEAFELYMESKKIFREGGFNLRKFKTNSKCLQERIDIQERPNSDSSPLQDEPTYSETTLGASQPPTIEEHKVLGILWNPESDQLIFDVTGLAKVATDLHPTKRNIVSLIGKFYDPIGFLSAVIIKFKILFQKLCQCKTDWDDVMPEDLTEEWRNLITDLGEARPISLQRSYLHGMADPLTSMTLCGFCDASTKAFAAVVYILLRTKTQCIVRFVAAKTRVAPLHTQTIPRLELLSAFLLSKLVVSVRNSLQH